MRSMGPTACAASRRSRCSTRTTSLRRLKDSYHLPYDRLRMHEVVLQRQEPETRARTSHARHRQAPDGLRLPPADDLLPAHRPRRAHDRADGERAEGDLDAFCDAMRAIASEAETEPATPRSAPRQPTRAQARRGPRREASDREIRLRRIIPTSAASRARRASSRRKRAADRVYAASGRLSCVRPSRAKTRSTSTATGSNWSAGQMCASSSACSLWSRRSRTWSPDRKSTVCA